jgi:hypothetical protein
MIAFSLEDLKSFNAKFILMVRNPRKVVESHFRKGWYTNVSARSGPGIPGYQYTHQRPNHFFSRIQPAESDAYQEWMSLTQLGKIAWMWKATYDRIFEQLKEIDPARYRWVYLDTFSFDQYIELTSFLKIREVLTEAQFDRIKTEKPGKGKTYHPVDWKAASKKEFNGQIESVMPRFTFLQKSTEWLFEGISV